MKRNILIIHYPYPSRYCVPCHIHYDIDMDVVVTEEALGQIESMPFGMVDRIWKVIRRLRNWPDVSGTKPLRGELKGNFRVRTGDYRIIFRIEKTRVVVWRVGNRGDIYED
jgi:mRNA-degrading endonuclease RelE of RelBE toxin-antitoxin system